MRSNQGNGIGEGDGCAEAKPLSSFVTCAVVCYGARDPKSTYLLCSLYWSHLTTAPIARVSSLRRSIASVDSFR